MRTLLKSPLLALSLALAALTAAQPLQAAAVTITNPGFELNTGLAADRGEPIGWDGAISFPHVYRWADVNGGLPPAEGVNALYASTSSAFGASSQNTSRVIAANETFTLTAAFGRINTNLYGGSWLRILLSNGVNDYTVANSYTFAGEPAVGLFSDKSVIWTAPSNLTNVAYISNGITGTTPNSFADLSSGGYAIQILVGGNFPSGVNDAGRQTGVDNVRLDAVPEPSTYALMGLSALGFVIFRRRKLTA